MSNDYKKFFFYKKKITNQKIRSFTLRERKKTKNSLNQFYFLWGKFGINFQNYLLNFSYLFQNSNPIILEIGFGIGDSIIHQAIKNKNINFLGIEVYYTGIFSCMKKAFVNNITNLKIIYFDAIDVLLNMIPDHSIQIIQIFFPDPWPKKKHNKRRLINTSFIKIIRNKLCQYGFLHVITDCFLYSNVIKNLISLEIHFKQNISKASYKDLISLRSISKFEKRSIFFKKNIFTLIAQNYIWF